MQDRIMTLGELLKSLRTQKGISIKKLAPILGLNYTYISKIENSKINPSPEVVRKLSDYFEYNPDELMLKAGKLPEDVAEILKDNPKEVIAYLREKFGAKPS